MVIDMNESQVRTLEQVRQVVAGTQAMEFHRAEDDEGRYAWIESVLGRLGYRQLSRLERGPVLAYLQHLSGYSLAQITRLVSRWVGGKRLVKQYRAPEHAFARRYTAADVALLAQVDQAMDTLSGPATACVLRRQRDVFGDVRFERLAELSVGHLYNLRASAPYRNHRVVLTKTRPTKAVTIGVRKAPAPEGRPGFIRIDSVHQGDWDGTKGVYHINAVDCVTQWEVVVVRKLFGYAHIPQRHAARLNTFCREFLNPFLNFLRPCLFATDKPDPKKAGRIKRVYLAKDAMTPLDKLASLAQAETFLREGVTLAELRALARALTDLQAGDELNEARLALFRRIPVRTG